MPRSSSSWAHNASPSAGSNGHQKRVGAGQNQPAESLPWHPRHQQHHRRGGSGRGSTGGAPERSGAPRNGNFDDDEDSYGGRATTPSPLRQHNKLLLSKTR
ncbi:unnamed protein product, partial [Discosporangium mesarthrocarpum]